MTIENSKYALGFKKQRFITILVFLLLFLVNIVEAGVPHLYPFNKTYITLIIASLYIILLIVNYFRNSNFLSFTSINQKITLKYYSLNSIIPKHKCIEIPHKSFTKYEEKKSLGGLKHEFIFYQRTKLGIAKYPPVSVNGFDRNNINKIKFILTSILTENK